MGSTEFIYGFMGKDGIDETCITFLTFYVLNLSLFGNKGNYYEDQVSETWNWVFLLFSGPKKSLE